MSILKLALMVCAVWIAAAPAQAQAAPSEDGAAKQKGWKIYLEARQAAGSGPGGVQVTDYAYDLETTIETPQGAAAFRSKWMFAVPTYLRQEIVTPNGLATLIFDGEKGWQAEPDDIKYLAADAVAQIRTDMARNHVLLNEPPPEGSVRFLKQEEVEGKPADVIQIADVGGTPLRLFVDAETRLVRKMMFVGDTPVGMAQVEEFLSDYREVGGYQWPHHTVVFRNGKQALEHVRSNLKVNQGLTKADIVR